MSSTNNHSWMDWIKAIVVALLMAYVIRSFIFATSVVQGESMDPTLQNGERVIFNKMIYLFDEPDRGDIVVIKRPTKNYVKRIIGLPNETIQVKDRVLYINGESYTQTFVPNNKINSSKDFGPVIIPSESYFVMGDNRSVSLDSRNGLGFIQEDEIIGRSEFIIYPFSEWARTK